MTSNTTAKFFASQGVSLTYIEEVIEAATRVNYGQNVDAIHGLEGACSMAAEDASGIAGGNFQLFEQFLKRSGANIFLNTPVQSITPKGHQWNVKSSQGSKTYKAVVLAAPFHQTGISIPAELEAQIPIQPYVNLHVTLLTTNASSPNPSYFGLPEGTQVPRVILTSYAGARKGGKEPEFNSLTYHGSVREGEWAVKIFSESEISDGWLEGVFPSAIGWVYRKQASWLPFQLLW